MITSTVAARAAAFAAPARILVAAGALLSIAACASNPVNAEWTDPGQAGRLASLRGTNVLVACEAPDVAVRNLCQDRVAAAISARGARFSMVPPDTTLVPGPLDPQLLPAARTADARALLVVTLTPAATENDRPSVSFGIGGFGFGGRSAGGGGVGLSTPVGEGSIATGFAANGRVTDVASGRLLWTASAAAAPSKDIGEQLDKLTQALTDSAARAGLF